MARVARASSALRTQDPPSSSGMPTADEAATAGVGDRYCVGAATAGVGDRYCVGAATAGVGERRTAGAEAVGGGDWRSAGASSMTS